MKTQNTKLAFGKNSIVELNDTELNTINGGSLGEFVEGAFDVLGQVVDAVHDAGVAVGGAISRAIN